MRLRPILAWTKLPFAPSIVPPVVALASTALSGRKGSQAPDGTVLSAHRAPAAAVYPHGTPDGPGPGEPSGSGSAITRCGTRRSRSRGNGGPGCLPRALFKGMRILRPCDLTGRMGGKPATGWPAGSCWGLACGRGCRATSTMAASGGARRKSAWPGDRRPGTTAATTSGVCASSWTLRRQRRRGRGNVTARG
jgi:hypothetical protein